MEMTKMKNEKNSRRGNKKTLTGKVECHFNSDI